LNADAIIAQLKLQPHLEGGYFRETFRDCGPSPAGRDSNSGRAHSTAIYFLLRAAEHSRWHRVDAAESGIFTAARRWNCASARRYKFSVQRSRKVNSRK
jgi:hypothetical protein